MKNAFTKAFRNPAILVLGLVGFLVVGVATAADLYSFERANDDGFGDAQNDIAVTDHDVVKFNNYVYVSVENTNGAQILRCKISTGCDAQADWAAVVDDGFGDGVNFSISMLAVFNDYIYAATQHSADGAEIWRSDTGNADDWEKVVHDDVDANGVGFDESGFGLGTCCVPPEEKAQLIEGDVVVSVGGEDRLFVGASNVGRLFYTDNGTTWKSATDDSFGMGDEDGVNIRDIEASDDYIYVALDTNGDFDFPASEGAQVWRCEINTGCDVQAEWSRITDPGLDPALGGTYDQLYDLELFGGYLYAATDEEVFNKGGQIWRCFETGGQCTDQSKWSRVVSNGFGNQDGNSDVLSLFSFADFLYATTDNGDDGAELWRSRNGSTWSAAATGGFGEGSSTYLARHMIDAGNRLLTFAEGADAAEAWIQSLAPTLAAGQFDVTAEKDGTGQVALSFVMNDPDLTDSGQVQVEYSIDSGLSYSQATLSTTDADTSATSGDPGIDNTQTYQIGTSGEFIDISGGQNTITSTWNSDTDEPDTNVTTARLRITTYDGEGEGDTQTTADFEIDNVDPVITDFSIRPSAAKAGELLTVTFTVDEGLDENPTVTIDGETATFVSSEVNGDGADYTYTYRTVGVGTESEGDVNGVSIATDDFLNQGNDTETVTLDFTPPTTDTNPDAGTYQAAQSITLSATDDGVGGAGAQGVGVDTIYYTTDGSDPTTASAQYAGPIAVNASTTIKYFATDNVDNQESIRTASYVIDADAPSGADSFVLGTVFNDADRDGTQDAGESGIESAVVQLFEDIDEDGNYDAELDVLQSTDTSDANGAFSFLGLAQDRYVIRVDETTIPAGYALTTGNNPGALALLDPGQGFTARFGYATPAATPDVDDGASPSPSPVPTKDADGGSAPDEGDTTTPVIGETADESDTPTDSRGGEESTESDTIIGGIRDFFDKLFGDEESAKSETSRDGTAFTRLVDDAVTSIFAPVSLAALAGAALNLGIVGTGFFTYLRYLIQLITEPFRLLAGNKGRRWGIVFDVETNRPIDLAIVRLFDVETGRLIRTSVTDRYGRYLFLVDEEKRYRMTVTKPHFTFPPDRDMQPRKDLYLGGVIERGVERRSAEVTDIRPERVTQERTQETGEQTVIRLDIPMTRTAGTVYVGNSPKPVQLNLATAAAFRQATEQERADDDKKVSVATRGRRFAHVISYLGPLVALISLILEPSMVNLILLALHILLLLLFRRLALLTAGKPWGHVRDLGSNQTLSRAVVRLFDEKYGKLLLAKVTAGDGRYAFLVGEGDYQLNANKESYLFPEGVVDVRGGSEREINEELGLRKERKA